MDWWDAPPLIVGAVLLLVAELLMLIGLVGFALVRASNLEAPAMLVTAMALLTLMLLIVYVIVRSNEVLTLVGVPLGALAAATSTIYTRHSEAQTSRIVAAVQNAEPPVVEPPEPAAPPVEEDYR